MAASSRRGGGGGNGRGRSFSGLSESKPADSASRQVADEVKAKVLQNLQSTNTPQNAYEVISYATQKAEFEGVIYVLKIKINTNPPTFIHVRVLHKLDGSRELSGVETGHTETDRILHF